MKCLALIIISMGLLSTSFSGHIAVFHVTKTGSYIKIMDALLQTIAPYHKITLYSVVHDEYPHPNVTVVAMKVPTLKSFFSSGMFETITEHGPHYVNYQTVMGISQEYIENVYNHPHMKELIENKPKFDLMLTFATFSEFVLQLSHVLNVPLVEISPCVPLPHVNDGVGAPIFLTSNYNFYSLAYQDVFSFFSRVRNYIYNMHAHLKYNWNYMPLMNGVTKKYLPPDTPPIETLHRNTSLLLVNTNGVLGFSRPSMPNMIEIGGIHCRPPKPLSSDLEDFLAGAGEHGIIYVSFGSSIRSKFPDYVTKSIVNVFRKLPQRIVWKWIEDIADVPSNVKISKWFSQQDILGHNKTKLFISQVGIFSLQETAYHGVPLLGMPISYDQYSNSLSATSLGYAETMPFTEFTEGKFYFLIKKILSNPKYKENAARIAKLYDDQPQTTSERVQWWIDYVLRHKGNPYVHNLEYRPIGLKRLDIDVLLFIYTSAFILIALASYCAIVIYKFAKSFQYTVHIKEKTI